MAGVWRLYLVLTLLVVGMLGMMAVVYQSAHRASAVNAPLVDAVMEFKNEVSTGYLWFEEILTGLPDLNLEVVWRHFDRADWYARAMIEGGNKKQGSFHPVEDPDLRWQIGQMRTRLAVFREMIRKRHELGPAAIAGSEIDRQTHNLFRSLVARADAVETRLHQVASANFQDFRLTLGALLTTFVLAALLVAIQFHRFERRRSGYLTELEQARTRAEQSEARFRDVTFSMADWIWETDANGRYTYCSDSVQDILGYAPEELLGKLPLETMSADEAQRSGKRYAEPAARTTPIRALETWNYHKDGSRVCLLTSGVPLLDEQGHPAGFRGVAKDITARKRADRALRESEQRYRALFEQAADSVVLIEAETGALVEFNDRAYQNLGYTAEEFRALRLADIEAIESPDEVEKHIETALEKGTDTFETKHRTRSGEIRDIRVSTRVITIRWKKYFVSIWSDITAQKRTRKALLQARDDLEKRVAARTAELTLVNAQLKLEVEERRAVEGALRDSEEALRQLSAALMEAQEQERARIAAELHDGIGQSFTAVKFAVEAALSSLVGRSCPEVHAPLRAVLPLIQEAIDDLRRIGTDLRPSTLDNLGIVATISWYIRRFQELYPTVRVEEEKEVAEQDVPGRLKTPLYRIFQEALNNVAQHSGAERVWIRLLRHGGELELSIRDNGCGFDPAGVAPAGAHLGRHIGLRSMRERAELTGGRFDLQSHTGKGTLVRVVWPLGDGIESFGPGRQKKLGNESVF